MDDSKEKAERTHRLFQLGHKVLLQLCSKQQHGKEAAKNGDCNSPRGSSYCSSADWHEFEKAEHWQKFPTKCTMRRLLYQVGVSPGIGTKLAKFVPLHPASGTCLLEDKIHSALRQPCPLKASINVLS